MTADQATAIVRNNFRNGFITAAELKDKLQQIDRAEMAWTDGYFTVAEYKNFLQQIAG